MKYKCLNVMAKCLTEATEWSVASSRRELGIVIEKRADVELLFAFCVAVTLSELAPEIVLPDQS